MEDDIRRDLIKKDIKDFEKKNGKVAYYDHRLKRWVTFKELWDRKSKNLDKSYRLFSKILVKN